LSRQKLRDRGPTLVAENAIADCSSSDNPRISGAISYGTSVGRRSRVSELKPMRDRTFEFGCAVIAAFRRIPPCDEAERVLWNELLKTQKSMAANSAESTATQSRRDFASKFQIVLKEAREASQLLRLPAATTPTRRAELAPLQRTCDEIIAILVTSLKTAKRRQKPTETESRD
jgi:four helix bundle protein